MFSVLVWRLIIFHSFHDVQERECVCVSGLYYETGPWHVAAVKGCGEGERGSIKNKWLSSCIYK